MSERLLPASPDDHDGHPSRSPRDATALNDTVVTLSRLQRVRLMQVWRSGGWPCRDALEIDLLAGGLLLLQQWPDGRETVALSSAGIAALAQAQRAGRRVLSGHDRLALKFGEHLQAAGRIVWRELSLRALVTGAATAAPPPLHAAADLLTAPTLPASDAACATPAAATSAWRMARPDLFSVRNTTVAAYLQPMVHEVKFSRADLLSDLRDATKRQAYQWLCSACYYVFPGAVAEPADVPDTFGVWLLHGSLEQGRFELARPARHAPCTLPFGVWMALAKATPMPFALDEAQALLGQPPDSGAGPAEDGSLG